MLIKFNSVETDHHTWKIEKSNINIFSNRATPIFINFSTEIQSSAIQAKGTGKGVETGKENKR